MTSTTPQTFSKTLHRTQRYGIGVAAAGAVAAILGLLVSAEAFFSGYLTAFMFWSGVSLGCLSLLMLHHVVLGAWGYVTQRILEAGALTVSLMAVLFIPLVFGLHELYEWTHLDVVAEDPVLQHKRAYLNIPFFLVRAGIYFSVWVGLAYLFRRWSVGLDQTGDATLAVRLRRVGAGGLVAHVLLITFASVDWVMSLDPHWFSTVFGWMLMVSQGLTAIVLVVVVLAGARSTPPLAEAVKVKHFHDYGNLMLAFVIMWAYLTFVQYFIIWSGNLPEDIAWYVERQHGLWSWIAPFLIVFHFVVPFFVLLARRSKRSVQAMVTLSAFLLVVHMVFVAWLVLPSFPDTGVHAFWIAGGALAGMGGAWAALFAWGLSRQPLLPQNDPRYAASLHPASPDES